MPMYKEHLLGGFACGMIVLFIMGNYFVQQLIPFAKVIEWMLCTLAGSLFPDVDVKSKGQQLFYKLIAGLIIFSLFSGHVNIALYIASISLLPLFARHRGLFHTAWFVMALPLGGALVAARYVPSYSYSLFYDAGFFIVGAFSHLLMDFGIKGFTRVR